MRTPSLCPHTFTRCRKVDSHFLAFPRISSFLRGAETHETKRIIIKISARIYRGGNDDHREKRSCAESVRIKLVITEIARNELDNRATRDSRNGVKTERNASRKRLINKTFHKRGDYTKRGRKNLQLAKITVGETMSVGIYIYV